MIRSPIALRCLLPNACAVALLAGCASARRQLPPVVNLPAHWTAHDATPEMLPTSVPGTSAPSAAGSIPPEWWRSFGDPVLDRLIDDVLAVNNDLAAAAIRVYRAQLQAGLVATNLTPDATLGGTGSVSRALDSHRMSRTSSQSGALSYELDLWGRLAAQRDAARCAADATQADRDAARLSLIGTTAALYWQIGYLNQQIGLGDADIAYAERALALVRAARGGRGVRARCCAG